MTAFKNCITPKLKPCLTKKRKLNVFILVESAIEKVLKIEREVKQIIVEKLNVCILKVPEFKLISTNLFTI